MDLYKIKLVSGRVLGPMPLRRIRDLILKNHILGEEDARAYPSGEWKKINQFPEIVDLLLKNVEGRLQKEKEADSDPASPLPGADGVGIDLPEEVDPLGPTQMLANDESERPLTVLPIPEPNPIPKAAQDAKAPQPEPKPMAEPQETEEKTTIGLTRGGGHAQSSSGDEFSEEKTEIFKKEAATENENLDPLASFESEEERRSTLAREETIMLSRQSSEGTTPVSVPGATGASAEKQNKLRIWIRVAVIGGLLGFALSTLLEEESGRGRALSRYIPFRPVMPAFQEKARPQESEKLYSESLRFYSLDHVEGYKKASKLLIDSSSYDPGNVRALALLASSYLNLIDASNKDESYFGVISRLIELAREKSVDLPEAVIADVEFMLVLSQFELAQSRIVEYTRKHSGFGSEMFFYLALVFHERGDYESAARYISNIPDNKAFSAKVFFLKAQIAEKLNSFEDAYREYAKAIKLNPEHVKSRLHWVKLLSKEGRLKESTEHLKFLLDRSFLLSPKDQAVLYFLESRYYQLGKNMDRAAESIEKSVKLDPKNSEYLLEFYSVKASAAGGGSAESEKLQKQARVYLALSEGERLIREGKYQEALGSFLLARETAPSSPLPLIRAGDMFYQLNNYPNALLNYKKAFEMQPGDLEVAGKYIRTLILSYEWDEALKGIEKIRRLPKGQSLVDRLSGDLYARQGQYVQALTSYRNAMKRDVIDPEVYFAYGKTLQAAKEFKSAPFFYALAVRFDPLNMEAVVESAKCIAQSESIDRGLIYLQEALRRYGQNRPDLLTAVAELQLQKGEADAAQTTLNRVIQANAEYAPPWKVQAQLYFSQQGRIKDAIDKSLQAWRSYSERNPADPSGYIERYHIFTSRNQFDKAFEELNKVFAVYPKYPNVHVLRGRLYRASGNLKEAVSEFERELKNNPFNINALIDRGKAQIEANAPVEAMKDFNQAMQIDPRNAEAKHQAGYASYLMKNFSAAIALYRSAIVLDQGNPLLYKRLGIALRAMGDKAGASEAFQKYLDLDPAAPDAKEVERYL